ncbi:MAG: MarR family transcriptional regulator [Candidatus Methanofastidiosia archaeon]
MKLTENERLMASVILIFIVYFGLDSFLSLVLSDQSEFFVRERLTFSFVVGMASGILFYWYSKTTQPSDLDKMGILKRTLTDDEMLILSIVRDTPGVTQDSLKFRTEFSKSKVSALSLNLEKKGIIQREKSGRTYKIFLSEWLK